VHGAEIPCSSAAVPYPSSATRHTLPPTRYRREVCPLRCERGEGFWWRRIRSRGRGHRDRSGRSEGT
jgi:hypothetical protein